MTVMADMKEESVLWRINEIRSRILTYFFGKKDAQSHKSENVFDIGNDTVGRSNRDKRYYLTP